MLMESSRGSYRAGGALLLDRDGVINRRILNGYVLGEEQLSFIPAFLHAFRGFSGQASQRVVVLSNQACIGKGLLSEGLLRRIMRRTARVLGEHGIAISAWYCCPHVPDAGCECRKPQPGLFAACAQQLGVDLQRSRFIGDTRADILAGRAAGCPTLLVDAADSESFEAARAFAQGVCA